jgi:hypothetical protein
MAAPLLQPNYSLNNYSLKWTVGMSRGIFMRTVAAVTYL